jgi:hypothetical protein
MFCRNDLRIISLTHKLNSYPFQFYPKRLYELLEKETEAYRVSHSSYAIKYSSFSNELSKLILLIAQRKVELKEKKEKEEEKSKEKEGVKSEKKREEVHTHTHIVLSIVNQNLFSQRLTNMFDKGTNGKRNKRGRSHSRSH